MKKNLLLHQLKMPLDRHLKIKFKMDTGPGHSCKHDIQFATLFNSKSKEVFTLQRYLLCFSIC